MASIVTPHNEAGEALPWVIAENGDDDCLVAGAHEDELLVVGCLRNEVTAWTRLFEMCQPRIIDRIHDLLGRSLHALEVANEVAAQVWVAVLADEGQLLRRFDAQLGARITTYMNSIAVNLALTHLRESRRRTRREIKYAASYSQRLEVAPSNWIEMADFVERLSPREAMFYRQVLTAASTTNDGKPLSDQNAWQLRHRIRQKLLAFINKDA